MDTRDKVARSLIQNEDYNRMYLEVLKYVKSMDTPKNHKRCMRILKDIQALESSRVVRDLRKAKLTVRELEAAIEDLNKSKIEDDH